MKTQKKRNGLNRIGNIGLFLKINFRCKTNAMKHDPVSANEQSNIDSLENCNCVGDLVVACLSRMKEVIGLNTGQIKPNFCLARSVITIDNRIRVRLMCTVRKHPFVDNNLPTTH